MIRTLIALTVAAFLTGFAVTPSVAQSTCAPRTDLARLLSQQHSETPVALGLASNGNLMEVFASNLGETWTLVMSMPNGLSCVVAAGEGWTPRLPQVASEIS